MKIVLALIFANLYFLLLPKISKYLNQLLTMPPKSRDTTKRKKLASSKSPGRPLTLDTESSTDSEERSEDSYDNVHNDEVQEMEGQLEQGELAESTDGSEGEAEEQNEEVPIGRILIAIRKQQKEMESKMMELVDQVGTSNHQHTWKKDGPKKQFEIASLVVVKLTAAQAAIASRQTKRVGELLKESLKILGDRIKELKIADASESGWETVNVYRSHPLADDAADDKKIRRAEKIAKERVAAKMKRGRSQPRNNYQRRYEGWNAKEPYMKDSRGYGYRSQGSVRSQDAFQRGTYVPEKRNSNYQQDPKRTICFFCGLEGHWQNACPKKNSRKDR